MTTRRAERVEQILSVAWELAREEGIGTFSLRGVARRIGISAPSLYEYFGSKDALFDAMFAQGWQQGLSRLRAVELTGDREADLVRVTRDLCRWTAEDSARYQLLFTHVVPGWHPSADSYAVALEHQRAYHALMAEIGITDPVHIELYTALGAGLIAQQAANDPSGRATQALVEPAVRMFLTYVDTARSES